MLDNRLPAPSPNGICSYNPEPRVKGAPPVAGARPLTFDESTRMNLQSMIVVILRLMALNFFLQAAVRLSPQLLRLSQITREEQFARIAPYLFVPVTLVIGLIMGGILIWVFALPIARLVTCGVSRDLSFGSLSLVDCYSVAFIGIGLFYIVGHFPLVLNAAHLFLKTAASGGDTGVGPIGYNMTQAFIPFIVGAFLFVKGRSWAVALARSQEQSETANQTVDANRRPSPQV